MWSRKKEDRAAEVQKSHLVGRSRGGDEYNRLAIVSLELFAGSFSYRIS